MDFIEKLKYGFRSAGSEFASTLARNLPTCGSIGSEFTNPRPNKF
jgi:hypothetical protein